MTTLNDVFHRGVGNETPPFAISRIPSWLGARNMEKVMCYEKGVKPSEGLDRCITPQHIKDLRYLYSFRRFRPKPRS
jgi:hypothetical protein